MVSVILGPGLSSSLAEAIIGFQTDSSTYHQRVTSFSIRIDMGRLNFLCHLQARVDAIFAISTNWRATNDY
jgi:hypothetical protein